MKKPNKRKGFTIVELVIVIAVISILAAVLIPTYNNVVERAKSTAALQEAKNTLDAYNAYMLTETNGVPLSEGAVFYNPDYNYYYVYAGSAIRAVTNKHNVFTSGISTEGWLTSFTEIGPLDAGKNTTLPDGYNGVKVGTLPTVTIDGIVYACDTIGVTFVGDDCYVFAYRDNKEVEFADGSNRCQIFAGRIIGIYTAIADGDKWQYADLEKATRIVTDLGTVKSLNESDAVINGNGYSCKFDTPVTIDQLKVFFDNDEEHPEEISSGTDGNIIYDVNTNTLTLSSNIFDGTKEKITIKIEP
jgi:prepilin-type N-terminal cleavage/methylation domain-containing protein